MPLAAGSLDMLGSVSSLAAKGVWRAELQHCRHFLDLPARSVAGIDDECFFIDFAEANKLLDRTKRGRPVVMFAGNFHQPIHAQFRHHRRFDPASLVAETMSCGATWAADAQRASCSNESGPKMRAVFVLAQEPALRCGRFFHQSFALRGGSEAG